MNAGQRTGISIVCAKAISLAALVCFISFQVLAQGLVQFNNRNTSVTPQVIAPVFLNQVGGSLLSGTNIYWRAALLGGPASSTPACVAGSRTNSWCDNFNSPDGWEGNLNMLASPATGATWVNFRTGVVAGFVAIGTDSTRLVPGVPYGGTAMVQVVAWEGTATNWQQAFLDWAYGGKHKIGASNPLLVPVTTNASDLNVAPLFGLESFAILEGLISDGVPAAAGFSKPC